MTAYQKCENLLRCYNRYKMGLELDGDNLVLTRRCIDNVDKAIAYLGKEKYIGIITMHYFDGLTMERIAEIYDISTVAVYSQRKRMMHKLSNILCSDDSIRELLSR